METAGGDSQRHLLATGSTITNRGSAISTAMAIWTSLSSLTPAIHPGWTFGSTRVLRSAEDCPRFSLTARRSRPSGERTWQLGMRAVLSRRRQLRDVMLPIVMEVAACPWKRSALMMGVPPQRAMPSATSRAGTWNRCKEWSMPPKQSRSPIILGFNGAFLAGDRAAPERLELYAAMGRAAAESSSVPCGLIFNECPRDDWVLRAIEAGFNLVMLADPAAPYADYVARVAAIARLAHARGVAVEGELGELPYGAAADGGRSARGSLHRSGGRG